MRSPRHQQLLAEFDKLNQQQKDLLVKNEFDRIYIGAGATGMNAGTSEDFTIYFINVPTNKLELWFWLESDRLSSPVFREFYSERDVVAEERRMRYDSTPTGRQLGQFDAMFWKSSPYGWPVIGWTSDLEAITRKTRCRISASTTRPTTSPPAWSAISTTRRRSSWPRNTSGGCSAGRTIRSRCGLSRSRSMASSGFRRRPKPTRKW